MASIEDIPRLVALIRKLVSFYAADKETRDAIKGLSDDEIIAYADECLDRAEEQNNAFIDRLENENE